ncbi:MAG TPA: hypothetical protein VK142_09450 [Bacillota bacterium]|nr:hypothetical protein [Bacillota bacterium]
MKSNEYQELVTILKEYFERMDAKFDRPDSDMNKGFLQVSKRFEQVDKQFDQIDKRFEQIDKRFEQVEQTMDRRFDILGKKVDGIRADLTETQETTDYPTSKVHQHEKKYVPRIKQQSLIFFSCTKPQSIHSHFSHAIS